MSLRPRLLAATLLFLVLSVAVAGAASLTGRIVDRETHQPVEGARVRLLESGRSQLSDAAGRFAFRSLRAGAYTLSAHHLAYADVERAIGVIGDADSVLVLVDRALYHTGAIVVRSTRSTTPVGSTPWSAATTSDEQIRETPALTMADAAARLPGLAMSRDGSWETALSIRGLGRSNVVALVDNARIETSTDLSGALSLVNPLDLERIEVMKSSGSVLFGSGSLGGAVQMVTRRASFSDRDRFGAEWTDGVTSVNKGITHYLAVEQTGAAHALRVSGGYRNASLTRTPLGELPNSQFRDASGNASLTLRTLGAQTLTAFAQRVQAEDTGLNGGAAFAPTAKATYTLARRQLFGLEYALPNLSPSLPLVTARWSRQEILREVEVVQPPAVVTPHATHLTNSGQLEARLAPGAGHLVIAGAELWHRGVLSLREKRVASLHRITGERPIPNSAFMSGGVYAQDDWEAIPGQLHVVIGGRHDWNRTHNDDTYNPDYVLVNGVPVVPTPGKALLWKAQTRYDHSWSANAGAHLNVSPHVSTSVLVATAYRSPSLEERYQYLDLGTGAPLYVGDPGLKPEQSVSVNVGTRLDFGATQIEASAFGNELTDLVADMPGTFPGAAPTKKVFVKSNVGQARLYGWELAGSQKLARGVAIEGAVAYVRGEDRFHHTNLPQIAPLSGHVTLALESRAVGTLRLTCDAAHTQGNPGAGETVTPGWADLGWNVASRPLAIGSASGRLRLGMENLFDRAYRLHLSTLRGVLRTEPGRNYFASVTFAL